LDSMPEEARKTFSHRHGSFDQLKFVKSAQV
jgi:hypothetical protein